VWHHYLIALRPNGPPDLRLLRWPGRAVGLLPVTAATHPATGSVAVVYGRFFYTRQQDASPAVIALAAFRTNGEKGLEALEGEFSAVVWDARTRALVGLRDPLGGGPRFWWSHPAGCGFSTDLRAARAAAGTVGVDREYLADFLAHTFGPGSPRPSGPRHLG